MIKFTFSKFITFLWYTCFNT